MKVTIGQVGSQMKEVELSSGATVADAVSAYGLEGEYVVKVNMKTASQSTVLSEGDFLTIGEKVKGGF